MKPEPGEARKILVVDDEEGIRYTFRAFLSKMGYEVETAEDYPAALAYLSRREPDVVLADVILGGHTGIDLLREIGERGLHCPVIVMTGEPSVETASASVELGAFSYLTKPVEKEALLRCVEMALQHKQLADEKLRIERENERNRRNLEAVFRSVKEGILTVDPDLRVTMANEALVPICGLVPAEMEGKPFSEVPKRCGGRCLELLESVLRTGEEQVEIRSECGGGFYGSRMVVLTCTPLLSREGRHIGAVLVIRDETRLRYLEQELEKMSRYHGMVGRSPAMQEIYRLIEQVAPADTSVLIRGESGTGKELVARAIHAAGPRSKHPFVAVNCSALVDSLLESELFGHVKGAFTGAVKDKVGRFEAAAGGTVFLDEIGDISPRMQLRLLRVLQEKEFERVGDFRPMRLDARIILATNRDLKERVRRGAFREDLYYRVKVFEMELPPLRDRREDIPLLVDHFVERLNQRLDREIRGVSAEVLECFMRYPWPGNVRELEHALEHAFILCGEATIGTRHLPLELLEGNGRGSPRQSAKEADTHGEAGEIRAALERAGGNKSKAARLLGISRRTLYRKMERYGLDRDVE